MRTERHRFDRAAGVMLGATPIEQTPEGYKVYRGIAAFGDVVLEYPEFRRSEYVPAAEALAPEIVATLVGVPFTIHHPEDLLSADDPDALKEHVEGTVRAARGLMERSPPELEVEVVVWTKPAQEMIESGEVAELSPGYRCREEMAAPKSMGPGGRLYDVIQRERVYNHLSGVRRARGVTPDGRRARLDEANGAPVYPQDGVVAMPELMPVLPDLSVFASMSPEAAEILKSLPPVDLEMLVKMVSGAAAPAVEPAAAAAVPQIEIEVEPAAAEGEGVEPAKPVEGEAEKPVEEEKLAPASSEMQDTLASIRDMFGKMQDMLAAMKPKADAAAAAAVPEQVAKADEMTTGAQNFIKLLEEKREEVRHEVRREFGFVAEVAQATDKRLDSVDAAMGHVVEMVAEHAPAVLDLARKAADAKRLDDLLGLYKVADERRRQSYVNAQLGLLDAVMVAPAGGTGYVDRGAREGR